ncbi:MAG: guanylate kinase [Clostridia bacterium]|nr:guanylate kinase [Clostridia bacterium]
MNKGGVFIISGPSGSGKDTLLKELFKKRSELRFSISSITREMREGEIEGEKYNFISKQRFEEMIAGDMLLEHNCYVGNYYGTPKAPVIDAISQGFDMVIEVDVNGAAQIKQKMPEAVAVFIMPPSFEELERRLRGRGTESYEVIKKRMDAALGEIARATEYDYIVVNDDIAVAVDDIITIIASNGLKLDNNRHIIEEVLKNVKS